MAVTVQRLTETDIPAEHRADDVDVLFRVTGPDGVDQYYRSELEAAKVATEMSDEERHGK